MNRQPYPSDLSDQEWEILKPLIRRLSKDYEYLPQSAEAFIYTAIIRLLLQRLV